MQQLIIVNILASVLKLREALNALEAGAQDRAFSFIYTVLPAWSRRVVVVASCQPVIISCLLTLAVLTYLTLVVSYGA